MRTISLSGESLSGTAQIPDNVVYAFNLNYVTLSIEDSYTGVLNLSVTDGNLNYDIDVTVFNGGAKCYISRLLQILFDDYVNTRSKNVDMVLKTAGGTTLGSWQFLVLWAAIEPGNKYGYYLPIANDVNWAGKEVREVVWFKNMPQKLSYFTGNAIVEVAMSANAPISSIKIIPCEDTDGTYLRWLDNYGFWQYFLFESGQRKSKNKLGGVSIDAEYSIGGVIHQAQRSTHIENTDTITCCAVSLKKEILAYVETIYKSPHIEYYVGKVNGSEVWKPVNIDSGNVAIAADRRLYDYEISITMPETQVQTI